MTDSIRVLVVDDIAETREHIAKLFSFEPDMELVGTASAGLEAIDLSSRLNPDVVLMDVNMPGMDGIETSERLARQAPGAAVVMMSVQNEAEYLRRSMLAGAREFLVKPFTADELVASVRQVHARQRESLLHRIPVGPGSGAQGGWTPARRGRVVAVFSPKGGVGRTTIAVNLAVVAATGEDRVALVDANFEFGDIALLLNLNPSRNSIADTLGDLSETDTESIDSALVAHATGINVLLAPPTPEAAELLGSAQARRILNRLKETYDLIVVDCPPHVQEPTLSILDTADVVLCVMTLDLSSIKNTRLFLTLADQLGYSADKVQIVLNRADTSRGIRSDDVERSIGRKIDYAIAADEKTTTHALNQGVPFVASLPQAEISRDVSRISRVVAGSTSSPAPAQRKPGLQRRLQLVRR